MTTLHLISHTHWDREWYLTFQQFRLRLVHLMDHLLELLKNDPDFQHFMLDGQTIVLDDYLQVRPEREAEIRSLVQQGRILIGPWHILPDEFLVGPESHLRNLLQGERTAQRFGPKMQIGYIPDPFGHIGQMPQILRGFGIETACVQRGLDEQPCEFWWDAPDGSRVLMAYLRNGYGNAANLPTANPEGFLADVLRERDSLQAHSSAQHLLLMHGTDHMLPPVDTTTAIRQANAHAQDFTILHSTLLAYIEAIRPTITADPSAIPSTTGELRSSKRFHLLPGVFSARMWIKQRNHTCEQLLTGWAEPFSTWAEWVSRDIDRQQHTPSLNKLFRLRQPSAALHQAWLLLMQCHPHDSICGCSVDQVHEEMRSRFDQVEQIGEEIIRQSLSFLADMADTQTTHLPSLPAEAIKAIVVFNPTATIRSDMVTVETEIPADLLDIEIVDEAGRSVPVQMGETENHGAVQTQLAWIASDLPGLGYRTYWLCAKRHQAAEEPASSRIPAILKPLLPMMEKFSRFTSAKNQGPDTRPLSRPPYVIENEHFIVEASASNGTLTITDRHTAAVFTGCNRFLDGGDCGDEYNFAPPWFDSLETPKVRSIRIHRDEVTQYLEINLDLHTPLSLSEDRKTRSQKHTVIPISTWVALPHGVRRVEVRTVLENTACDHRLRVHFPVPFHCSEAMHDGHFEIVRRPVGIPPFDDTWAEQPRPEVPQRCFTSVNNSTIGLLVANRGLPEVEVLNTPQGSAEVAMTLLRCVGWLSRDDFSTRKGHAGPMIAVPGAQEPGLHTFEYALMPFDAQAEPLPPHQAAREFCAPPRAVVTDLHPGWLPPSNSMLSIRPLADNAQSLCDPIVLSTVKFAETPSSWLLRIYNTCAETQTAKILPWRPFAKVWKSNLAEQPLEHLETKDAGQIPVTLRGHEILTILLKDEGEYAIG